jgi:lysophospholipase L1-like esterase
MRLVTCLTIAFLIATLGCGSSHHDQPGTSGSPSPSPGAGAPTPATWPYTALGDSLAVGILASQGYVSRYDQYVQADTGNSVPLSDLGQNGWTSADLLSALKNNQQLRSAVAHASVITWDIGGNDLLRARVAFYSGSCGGSDNQDCLRSAVSTFGANWDAIVAQIVSLRSPGSAILRTMDVYNPFVAEDQASGNFALLNAYLDQVNQHIATSADRNGIPFAQVHQAFNGSSGNQDAAAAGLISIDGVHPNDNGHKVIADLLRRLGYAPLRP